MLSIEYKDGVVYPAIDGVRCTVKEARAKMLVLPKSTAELVIEDPIAAESYRLTRKALTETIKYAEIMDNEIEMHDTARDELIAFLCKGCQAKTRKAIAGTVRYASWGVSRVNLMERLYWDGTEWEYTAATSYPEEVRALRKYFYN